MFAFLDRGSKIQQNRRGGEAGWVYGKVQAAPATAHGGALSWTVTVIFIVIIYTVTVSIIVIKAHGHYNRLESRTPQLKTQVSDLT